MFNLLVLVNIGAPPQGYGQNKIRKCLQDSIMGESLLPFSGKSAEMGVSEVLVHKWMQHGEKIRGGARGSYTIAAL